MQYKKMKSVKNPYVTNDDFVTINMINASTRKKTGNRRIISIIYNGNDIMKNNQRYKSGVRYVEWFKI